jgi:energy-coupling factor transporter ATP-binding protein EcfA2
MGNKSEFWQGLEKKHLKKINRLMAVDFYKNFNQKSLFFNYLLDDLIHMLIVGPTGTGKSKMVEALIRHLTKRKPRPTVILLDPGGSTAQAVENWALKKELFSRLAILDPAEENFYLTYNPMRRASKMKLELQARYVQEAILIALEIDQKDSVYYQPMLERVLYSLSHVLMETGYGLKEAGYLLTNEPNAKAMAIIDRAKTEAVKDFWLDLQKAKARDRQQILALVQARLLPFLTSELIQRMAAFPERGLDFSNFIESGKLFLVNLEAGSSLSRQDSKLLANLLISSIVRACFSRPANTGREVYLFIEECGEGLIGTEIGLMLRRARKQNLKVILLNQDISSLIARNKEVFYQIWSNTNFKVAFGDLPFEDLKILAYEFYGEEFNLKDLKDEIYRTYFEPKESARTIYSSSDVDTWGESKAHTTELLGSRASEHIAQSSSRASMSGDSTVPFYEYLPQKELAGREYWSIEEHLHQVMVSLKGMKRGQIALKRRNELVKVLNVPYISDIKPPANAGAMKERIFKESGFYATIEEVEEEEARKRKEIQPYAD